MPQGEIGVPTPLTWRFFVLSGLFAVLSVCAPVHAQNADSTGLSHRLYTENHNFGFTKAEACEGATLEARATGLWSEPENIALYQDCAYLAMVGGVMVMDVSDPAAPRQVNLVYLAEWAMGIHVSGSTLFVTTRGEQLLTFDLSDPAKPAQLAKVPIPTATTGLLVQDSLLYLACDRLFEIYSVADPSAPTLIGSCSTATAYSQWYKTVRVKSQTAYVADNALYIIDVSDPTRPSLQETISSERIAVDLEVVDSLIIVLGQDNGWPAIWSVLMVYAQRPGQPTARIALDTIDFAAYSLTAESTIAIVANSVWGTMVYDLSVPDTPHEIARIPIAGRSYATALRDSLLYIAHQYASSQSEDYLDRPCLFQPVPGDPCDNSGDFLVVSLAQPDRPQELGRWRNPGHILTLAAHDSLLYCGTEDSTLVVCAKPDSSLIIGFEQYRTHGAVYWSEFRDSLLLVGSTQGLEIFVLDSAGRPRPVGFLAIPAHGVWGLASIGNYVLLCCAQSGLWVADISNLTAPTLVGQVPTVSAAFSAVIQGRYAFATDLWDGVAVLDLATLPYPTEVAHYRAASFNDWAITVLLKNSLLAVADGSMIDFVDVSDPLNPTRISQWQGDEIRSIGWSDAGLLAADFNGVRLIDTHLPSNPVVRACHSMAGWPYAVASSGSRGFAADWFSLLVFDLPTSTGVAEDPQSLPIATDLGPCYPNPFNGLLTIPVTLARRTHIRLSIFNMLGQEVAVLADEEVRAGATQFSWNGSVGGKPAASGVYFVRLRTSQTQSSRRVLLLK